VLPTTNIKEEIDPGWDHHYAQSCFCFIYPLVLWLPITYEIKTTLSGLLIVGIPQGLSATAIAVVGKTGYQYLKQLFFKLINRNMPPDQVSKQGYNLGLVMFVIPLVLAWAHPIVLHYSLKYRHFHYRCF
jgi:hypothetical protein